MKSLYETIFDTTATPEDFLKPEFIKGGVKDIEIESRTLTITKSEREVHIYDESIEAMKKCGLDTIKFTTDVREIHLHTISELYNGISIEAPKTIRLQLNHKSEIITGLSIKAQKIIAVPSYRSHSEQIVFKMCSFEAEKYQISNIFGNPKLIRFEQSCTLKVSELEYELPDEEIGYLYWDNKRANGSDEYPSSIVNFFDHLPGPMPLFKKIDKIEIYGTCNERETYIRFIISTQRTHIRDYDNEITLDVSGPWKYGGWCVTNT